MSCTMRKIYMLIDERIDYMNDQVTDEDCYCEGSRVKFKSWLYFCFKGGFMLLTILWEFW